MAAGTVATWVAEEVAIRVHTAVGAGAGWHRCRAEVGVGTVVAKARVGTTDKEATTEEGPRMEEGSMAWAAAGRGKSYAYL